MGLKMKNFLSTTQFNNYAYFLSKTFDENLSLERASTRIKRCREIFLQATELAGKSFPWAKLRPGEIAESIACKPLGEIVNSRDES